ncbi:MAG: FG-GAP-like repeat-containing protein, partial [Planctomycetota bacterium]
MFAAAVALTACTDRVPVADQTPPSAARPSAPRGGSGESTRAHTTGGPVAVQAGDLDGDGDLDVVAGLVFTSEIRWWENAAGDGSGWVEHVVDVECGGPVCIHLADIDGDADTDVLAAASGTSEIAWWENTPTGSMWTKHVVDTRFGFATSTYAADVDGDGDQDVLGAAGGLHDIAWWENRRGDGTTWTLHLVDRDFQLASSVHAADVDGDGDVDVIGAANAAMDITWWENSGVGGSVTADS